jgi:hypothetical protein
MDIDLKFDPAAPPIGSGEKPPPPFCNFTCAKINCRAGGKASGLIYMKPVDPPSVSMDVRAYPDLDLTFPRESTHDQFFDESRKLGRCEAAALACGATTRAPSAGAGAQDHGRDKRWRAM